MPHRYYLIAVRPFRCKLLYVFRNFPFASTVSLLTLIFFMQPKKRSTLRLPCPPLPHQANDGTSCGLEDDEEEEELALNWSQPRAPTVVRRAGGALGSVAGSSGGSQTGSFSSSGPRSKHE